MCSSDLVFEAFVRPHLKKRYHNRVKRVRDYLETVKDFDELISPQSLFLHFLGPKPSNHIWKNVETKKSKFTRIIIYTSRFNILVLNFPQFSLTRVRSSSFFFFFLKEWQPYLVREDWPRSKRRKPRLA